MIIVLMCRPGLISTLLKSRVMQVARRAIDDDGADKDASASGESSFGEAFAEGSKFVDVHLNEVKGNDERGEGLSAPSPGMCACALSENVA